MKVSSHGQAFDTQVERALREALTWPVTSPEEKEQRLKALSASIKWVAVKAKILTADHGLGFLDEDEPENGKGF